MARKILLADDSVTAQNMGRKILADAGYEVIAVNNGSAALKKIAELKPDLVILDVYMPGYSGLEVCQRLKESQESARIPVLLTVGKLEPFKPEEAQRVRAEGYIVKPFEASELLSALSKLEDKVVPRAEPSKPGRFARAIAAVEGSGRSSSGEGSGGDNGWKSRISFPHKKTEAEEQKGDEPSTYNPVNRDLRTVVETDQEKAEDQKRQAAGRETEATVDVAAVAPSGLPKDVTEEEIAAMTAAAAQMQVASAAIQEHPQVSETASQAGPQPTLDKVGFEPPMQEFDPDALASRDTEVNTAAPKNSKEEEEGKAGKVEEQISAPAADGKYYRRKDDARPPEAEQPQDVPVTMAVGTESVAVGSESAGAGTPRWQAVSVALESDEASLSLDHEMQKAYAAAQVYSAVATPPEANAALAETASAHAEPVVEASIAAISNSELTSLPEPSAGVAATEARGFQASQTEQLSADSRPDAEQRTGSEVSSTESLHPIATEQVAAFTSDIPASDVPVATSVVQEVIEANSSPVNASEVPASAGSASQSDGASFHSHGAQGLQSAQVNEGAEVATSNEVSHAIAEHAEADREPDAAQYTEVEPAVENETLKNAAAWANWRQVRDSSQGGEPSQAPPADFEAVASVLPETNAKAVAAGAEQIMQAVAAAEPGNSPADVASIVDSVLAGLRPKLMEEISRKMAEKK